MRKIFALLLAVCMIACMVIPAYAATPALKIPDIPTVPEIKVEVKLPEKFWADWFVDHPIKINVPGLKLG